jgi:hypothetical protein
LRIWAHLFLQRANLVARVARWRALLEPQSPGAVPRFHYAAARAAAAQLPPTLPVARLRRAGSSLASLAALPELFVGRMESSPQSPLRPVVDQAVAHLTRAQVVLGQMVQSAAAAAVAAAV